MHVLIHDKTEGQIPLGSWENKTHKLKKSIRDISSLTLRHLQNKIAINSKGNALEIKFNGKLKKQYFEVTSDIVFTLETYTSCMNPTLNGDQPGLFVLSPAPQSSCQIACQV